MQYTEDTPRKSATIQTLSLQVINPFAEGHPLTATEAAVLNQTFTENVRNNFATVVKATLAEVDGNADEIDMESMQAALDAYMTDYEFGIRRSGGGGSRAMDPVERKAMELSRTKVRDLLRTKGYKLKDFTGTRISELAASLLEKTPALMEEAKRQIEISQELATDVLDGFDLTPDEASVEAPAQEEAA